MNIPKKRKAAVHRRRPAETATAAVGSLTALAEAFSGVGWAAVATGIVAWLPAAFTWLVSHGGIAGVFRLLFRGAP